MRITICSILFLFISTFSSAQNQKINLKFNNNYPSCFKTYISMNDHHSGITYIKLDSGKKYFSLADNVKKIETHVIEKDTVFEIYNLKNDFPYNQIASLEKVNFNSSDLFYNYNENNFCKVWKKL